MTKNIRRLIAAVLGISMIALGAPVNGTISYAASEYEDPSTQDFQKIDNSGEPSAYGDQSKPENGTLALKGTAAPQDTPTKDGGVEHRDGGATQYYIETPNKNWCNKVN